ncbi:hypothetical protein BMW23_058 [Bodo saltans virus]|uniref:Minor capsid protein P8 central region domain-containing protein n=1 Tax=Bodo saltans virus TaxID=2024608 RepID=A0A2H4UUT5_9VIRU|nr:hypothetical protein QJ851_gp0564 [Bodo saltans virus]ATZ80627.1 hypothetical protein BMW23_058 [Bodo saltans virus]
MYAELNPKINYNRALPANTTNMCQYSETPAFTNYNKKCENKFSDYYDGGASSFALGGMQIENTPVSLLFFSDENVKRIQKLLKRGIADMSKGKFILEEDQDENDLFIVMRAVFLDSGLNLPTHIVSQVKELNKKTVEYILPDMYTNVKQAYGYLQEINNPRKIMSLPLNVNKTQRGDLPSVTSLWK